MPTTQDALADVISRIQTLEETVAGFERAHLGSTHLKIARADLVAAIGALISIAQHEERQRLETLKQAEK